MALATFGGNPASGAPAASGLYYERVLMAAADGRCRLFSPEVGRALEASALEARGAALRAGAAEAELAATATRARDLAAATPCSSRDLQSAAEKVRRAFQGWASLRQGAFPGAASSWTADRRPSAPLAGAGPKGFALIEAMRLAGRPAYVGVLPGVGFVLLAPGVRPTALAGASLVVRDPARAPRPLLTREGRALPPPALLARSFLARDLREAPPACLPEGQAFGSLVLFPDAALDAVSALDPRERAQVSLILPSLGGDRSLSGDFEVGDLAAARAFLAAGGRRP